MGSWEGAVVVLRKVPEYCKSHQWLWQVEGECGDHWQLKVVMDSLEVLQST